MVKFKSFTLNLPQKSVLPNSIPNDDYDPFAHRSVDKPTSTLGSFFHLVKSSLGMGVFAMPLAFKHGGYIFGLIATIAVGIICTHCIYMLVESSHKICKKIKKPSLGFAETAEMVLANGPLPFRRFSIFAKKLCEIGMVVTYVGACCVYIVLIASSLQSVINKELNLNWPIRVYIAFVILACLFMGQIRRLKYLVPCSMVANLLILAVLGITFYITLDHHKLDIDHRHKFTNWAELPGFFSIVIFAMEGVGTIMPIENNMKHPEKFLGWKGVLNGAMLVVVSLYTVIGYFGYMRFGDSVVGSITLNLPMDHVLSKVVQYLIALAIFFTFGLMFYVPIDITWLHIKSKVDAKHQSFAEVVYRSLVVLFMGCIAMAVPNLDPYISLIGAVCMSILGLFVPTAIHSLNEWPNTGRFHWILIKDVLVMIASLMVLVSGTWVSMVKIIQIYS